MAVHGSRRRVLLVAAALGLGACGGNGGARPDAAVGTGDASVTADAAVDAGSDAGVLPQGCRDGWCWLYPKRPTNTLTAITGSSSTDVWVVGRGGAILHYDGSDWSQSFLPGFSIGEDLFRIHRVAQNDLWACGDRLYHWNGSAWSASDTVSGCGAFGSFAANDVWFAGGSEVRHWDGSSWSTRPVPAVSGRVVALLPSNGSLYAASSSGGIAKWLGTSWGVSDAGSHEGNAAAFISPTELVIAGDNGVVWFFDGNLWTPHPTPQTTSWNSVVAASLMDVWVSNGRVAAHWNGTSWTQGATGAAGYGAGLWLDPTGAPWVAGDFGEVLSWTGSSWSKRTAEGQPDILDVGGIADDDFWVTTPGTGMVGMGVAGVGARHWNGTSWTDFAAPAEAAKCVSRGIWAAATNDVWVALGCRATGNDDFQLRRLMHWNGSAWSIVESLGAENQTATGVHGFNAIWGSAANDVYAVAETAVYHFDGNAWTPVTNGPPGGVSVFGRAANDVYVTSTNGLWHWNGSQWTSRSPTASGLLYGLQTAADSVWLGGQSGGNFYDGQFFVQMPFTGQPIGNQTDVFVEEQANGYGYVEAHYVGGFNGTRTATPAFFTQGTGWRSPSGATYVVDRATCYGCGNMTGGLLVHAP